MCMFRIVSVFSMFLVEVFPSYLSVQCPVAWLWLCALRFCFSWAWLLLSFHLWLFRKTRGHYPVALIPSTNVQLRVGCLSSAMRLFQSRAFTGTHSFFLSSPLPFPALYVRAFVTGGSCLCVSSSDVRCIRISSLSCVSAAARLFLPWLFFPSDDHARFRDKLVSATFFATKYSKGVVVRSSCVCVWDLLIRALFGIMRVACDGALLIACLPLAQLFSICYPHTCLPLPLPLSLCQRTHPYFAFSHQALLWCIHDWRSHLLRRWATHWSSIIYAFVCTNPFSSIHSFGIECPTSSPWIQSCCCTCAPQTVLLRRMTRLATSEWQSVRHSIVGAFLCSAFVAMAPYTFLSVLYVAHLGQSISWASFPQYHHSSSEVSTLSQWFLSSSQIDGPVYFSRLILFSSSIRTASWHIQAPSPQNVIKSWSLTHMVVHCC